MEKGSREALGSTFTQIVDGLYCKICHKRMRPRDPNYWVDIKLDCLVESWDVRCGCQHSRVKIMFNFEDGNFVILREFFDANEP